MTAPALPETTATPLPEPACAGCGASVVVPAVVTPRSTLAEIWDAVTPPLVRLNWAVLADVAGGRYALCPACVRLRSEREAGPLEPHDPGSACPKCGHRPVATAYRTGREPQSLLWPVVREHLARKCGGCGFEWAQAPKAGHRGILTRLFKRKT